MIKIMSICDYDYDSDGSFVVYYDKDVVDYDSMILKTVNH